MVEVTRDRTRIAFGRDQETLANTAVNRRAVAFVAVAVVVAAGCVRLGFWQLHRLAQRRAINASLLARSSLPPADVRDVLRDSAATYRRVTAAGEYDFSNEFALAARTHQGSPGINIVTPLRILGSDTAVLVNRGWVYAADAMTADFGRWREPSAARVAGYLVDIPRHTRGAVTAATNARVVRNLALDSLAKRLPYPVAPFMVVVTDVPRASPTQPAEARDSTPARLPAPMMDEGPHLGYAIQWFSFAFIAIVGAGVAVRSDRRGSYHAKGRAGVRIHPSETRHG